MTVIVAALTGKNRITMAADRLVTYGWQKQYHDAPKLWTTDRYATGTHLAEISGNGTIVLPLAGRMAIGSGYAEALGRLGDAGPWTDDDVIDAVRRAIQTAVGVDGTISVVDTKTLKVREVPPS